MREQLAGRGRVREARPTPEGIGASAPDYNILTIVIDDAGVEWFRQYYAHYGVRWGESGAPDVLDTLTLPFFEECADAGLMFLDYAAYPICGSTRSSLQTGRHSFRHGHNINIRDPGGPVPAIGNYFLPLSELTIAEYIKSQRPDYATGAFGKWHMADQFTTQIAADSYGAPATPPNANLGHPGNMGYDHADTHPANIGGNYTFWRVVNGVVTEHIEGDATATFDETTYPTCVFRDAAIDWLAGRDKFFCYVAFGPPHSLFRAPPYSMLSLATSKELFGAGISPGNSETGFVTTNPNLDKIWRASMEATDTACRQIWESLTPEVRARTVLVITGDNGTTAEGQRAGFSHFKRQLYWGGTRAPFVVRGPMVANPGERVRCIAQVQDLFDTYTDILGLPRAPNVRDSVSLMPVLRNAVSRRDPNALREFIYMALGTNQLFDGQNEQWALYDGRFRTGLMAGLASVIMTDEALDPQENTNVAAANPERYAEMVAYQADLITS